ncbi:MAG: hypothetical protein KatS3mg105_2279 [Gemmatales bacterium]|nr:MAG: hypothetical protein KatS3mg105_2279 [Gemmatales bacterium]
MPTMINKQRILNAILTNLKKRYRLEAPESLPVLEQFIYAICREGATRAQADIAFKKLREQYFDWNEIRVSSTHELEETLADLPKANERAYRLIRFLQEVFETTFSFDLESLQKKGLKQAAKHLSRYQAANDYIVAMVVQRALNGHAIPLDAPTIRVLKRLGLIEADEESVETMRASIEHLVPKARGPLFSDLISALAEELCHETEPECGKCPLSSECPSAQECSPPVAAGRRKPR